MKIEVKYYAWMREAVGEKEVLEVEEGSTVEKVVKKLIERHASLKEENFIVAVDGRIVNWDTGLKNGDIMALFPPAGGG